MSGRALVYGVGVAGLATVNALVRRGHDVLAVDDDVNETKAAALRTLGVDLLQRPAVAELDRLIATSSFVAPAPGVPENHPVVTTAQRHGVPLKSELDLAYEWEMLRASGPRPMLAVTGTDGKTTTVTMVDAMLRTAGRRSVACGNTEIPLVEAIDSDVEAFVVEATSFRLRFAESFRVEAAAWLNLAPDHLDWHESMTSYEQSKARLWTNVRSDDVAIGFVDDDVVMKHLRSAACRRITFGTANADYRCEKNTLVGPHGRIGAVSDMKRSLPHDITNALAASALVLESNLAPVEAVQKSLQSYVPPHHRIEFVAEHRGITWFDDSKATTPHAAMTAIRGFDSVVLIAGGRNKGLDLSPMSVESSRIHAVVALGEAATEIAAAFHGRVPVKIVDSMHDAVHAAATLARPGDVVLLSPGCTSLDQYSGYAARGEDFARHVSELIDTSTSRTMEVRS